MCVFRLDRFANTCVVQFKVDGYTAVVPLKKVVGSSTLKEGDDFEVLRNRKETYVATVIALGK